MSGFIPFNAEEIATKAHKGQTDRLGRPYIEHVLRVAAGFSGDTLSAALLHDVVEDTNLTLGSLLDAGVPYCVLEVVDVLTRREGESYCDYILRIGRSRAATRIKRSDLRDHLAEDRAEGIGKHQRDKYELALVLLSGEKS